MLGAAYGDLATSPGDILCVYINISIMGSYGIILYNCLIPAFR